MHLRSYFSYIISKPETTFWVLKGRLKKFADNSVLPKCHCRLKTKFWDALEPESFSLFNFIIEHPFHIHYFSFLYIFNVFTYRMFLKILYALSLETFSNAVIFLAFEIYFWFLEFEEIQIVQLFFSENYPRTNQSGGPPLGTFEMDLQWQNNLVLANSLFLWIAISIINFHSVFFLNIIPPTRQDFEVFPSSISLYIWLCLSF